MLAVLTGCAAGLEPEWWEDAATVSSPVGGVWHSEDGRCLWTGRDRVEWEGVDAVCDWLVGDDGSVCVTGSDPERGTVGYELAPFHARDGYTGGQWFTNPVGETMTVQPGCWEFGEG